MVGDEKEVAHVAKKKKVDAVPITLRIPREQKERLDDLVERMPGMVSLNSLLLGMLDSSLPVLQETVKMYEMMKNAPNPSLVAERMEAFLEDRKQEAGMYAGLVNTSRREVAAQEEAADKVHG
jgi:hypothetical protein